MWGQVCVGVVEDGVHGVVAVDLAEAGTVRLGTSGKKMGKPCTSFHLPTREGREQ